MEQRLILKFKSLGGDFIVRENFEEEIEHTGGK